MQTDETCACSSQGSRRYLSFFDTCWLKDLNETPPSKLNIYHPFPEMLVPETGIQAKKDLFDVHEKFARGKIYLLYDKKTNTETYVGSTYRDLRKKLRSHYLISRDPRTKSTLHQTLRDFGYKNVFAIQLLESFHCETEAQLLQKQQEYIAKLKPTLNSTPAWYTIRNENTGAVIWPMGRNPNRKPLPLILPPLPLS